MCSLSEPVTLCFYIFCLNSSGCTIRGTIYKKYLSIEKNNNNRRKIMRDIVEICKNK